MSAPKLKLKMPGRGEPFVPPTLMEKFAQCVPEFRAEIEQIAKDGGHSVEYVFALWQDYCNTYSDQSNIVWEFKRFYAKQLAPVPVPPVPVPLPTQREVDARVLAVADEAFTVLDRLAAAAARIVEDDDKPTLVHMRELDRWRAAASLLIAKVNGGVA